MLKLADPRKFVVSSITEEQICFNNNRGKIVKSYPFLDIWTLPAMPVIKYE